MYRVYKYYTTNFIVYPIFSAIGLSQSELSSDYESEKEEHKEKENTFVKEELPEILNLDEIIEEFKTSKEYKFIYLVYAVSKTSRYFSPYSFKTVMFKNINKHCFFTLSNEGVMSHIHNEVGFTPFAKFEEDYRCYQKLMEVS